MRLEGASALVTGGASGLGAATARLLADHGAGVVITDLPDSSGADTAAGIGKGTTFVASDITDGESLDAPLDAAVSNGPLRFVVHCAGRGGDRLRILDRAGAPNPESSFADVLRVNLIGTYNVLRMAASRMASNEVDGHDRGAFVLTASVAAFDGQVGQTSYSASKAGVHGMTLVAARDLASFHIRVNTIAPGLFDTPMLARFPDDVRAKLASNVPHPHRLGHAEDYAHMALSLLTNSYVNGETVRLDGAIRMPPR
jgi:NAD(P)-dependent dehydrogenase (short-subunit alcohol dehydrogenase family)